MSPARNGLFFAVVVAASLGFAYWLYAPDATQSLPPESATTAPALFYPDLSSKLDQVTQMRVQSAEHDLRFVKTALGWQESQFHYPIREKLLSSVLKAIAQMRKLEPKTSNPAFYTNIGVDEKDVKEAGSYRFSVQGQEKVLADFLLGNAKESRSELPNQWFVRAVDAPTSWLVEGKFPVRADLNRWLDTRVFPLQGADLAKLVVRQDGVGDLVMARQEANQWKVVSMPKGFQDQSKDQPEMIDANLLRIEFTDLVARSSVKLKDKPDWIVELYLQSGEGLRLQVYDQPKSLVAVMSFLALEGVAPSKTAIALAPYVQAWKQVALTFPKEELKGLMQP